MDKALRLAEVVDAWRLVPRILVAGYAWLVWDAHMWATSLPDLSPSQSAYVAVAWGAATGVFGLYVGTGRRWTQ